MMMIQNNKFQIDQVQHDIILNHVMTKSIILLISAPS